MLLPGEIDRLQHLLGDEATLKVIEKVFNETLDNNLPAITAIDKNEVIGEKYRAYEQAKGIIKAALLDLMSYKVEVDLSKEIANRGK